MITMAEMEFHHNNLEIYQYPNLPPPSELKEGTRPWLLEQLRLGKTAVAADASVINLCSVAVASFHLVTFFGTQYEILWETARAHPAYAETTENDVNRAWASSLLEIDEPRLAARTLYLAVKRMRHESVDRQAQTAVVAAFVAGAEKDKQKLQLYLSEADQLWKYAIEIGEPVDLETVDLNKQLLEGVNSSYAASDEPWQTSIGVAGSNRLTIPAEVFAQAKAMQGFIKPDDAVRASTGNLL